MDPETGRVAFHLAFFFFFMSAVMFLFLDKDSPSFVANTFSFIVSFVFLLIVIWEIRRQTRQAILS